MFDIFLSELPGLRRGCSLGRWVGGIGRGAHAEPRRRGEERGRSILLLCGLAALREIDVLNVYGIPEGRPVAGERSRVCRSWGSPNHVRFGPESRRPGGPARRSE